MINIQIGGHSKSKIMFVYEDVDSANLSISGVFKGEFLSCFPQLEENSRLCLYVGLGTSEQIGMRQLMDVLAKGVRELKRYNRDEAEIDLSGLILKFGLDCIPSIVLGAKLGLYEFCEYQTTKKDISFRFCLTGIAENQISVAQKYLIQAGNLADAIVTARNLVNTPANFLTPGIMADLMKSEAEKCGVHAEILDEKEIAALGMGAFLAVGNSSGNPPRLIVLRYFADPSSKDRTALVGKGVTCDTGGYCLKSGDSMLGIKGDMAGGAAVANAIFALARNNIKTNVVGIIPSCENRISRESFIPGDIIKSMSGRTIEIRNTDAEGRLILADAVTYAIRKEGATQIIDIATLTGAVVNALGFTTAGVLTDSDRLWNELIAASQISGEQYWRLPIFPEYGDMIRSKIADIRNTGERYCGTITAGLFIKAFAEDLPWLHIDIAGTAWVDTPVFEHQTVGATGAAVATLYQLFSKEEK